MGHWDELYRGDRDECERLLKALQGYTYPNIADLLVMDPYYSQNPMWRIVLIDSLHLVEEAREVFLRLFHAFIAGWCARKEVEREMDLEWRSDY